MDLGGGGIKALASLLKDPEAESDSEDDQPASTYSQLGPGQIGPQKKNQEVSKPTPQNSKDIWNTEEVQEGSEFEDVYDPRPQPEYDIVYSQDVTSEDIFLGMGNKTPATASCETMTIKITLPNTRYAEVELNVTDKFLDCRTPKYKLGLHLPHMVDSKNGKAKWDGDKGLLTVTAKMKREYDFVNF